MDIFNKENLHILGLFIFSIGLGLGLGGSVVRLLLSITKNPEKQKPAVKKTFVVIWVGIMIYGVGGAILFGLAYKEMLKLGLPEFGNIGSFNFALCGPTQYPNCLVEVAFLSNKEDELLIKDPAFHRAVANAIVAGIKEWLGSLSEN